MTDVLIAQLPEAEEYVQGWLGAAIDNTLSAMLF